MLEDRDILQHFFLYICRFRVDWNTELFTKTNSSKLLYDLTNWLPIMMASKQQYKGSSHQFQDLKLIENVLLDQVAEEVTDDLPFCILDVLQEDR